LLALFQVTFDGFAAFSQHERFLKLILLFSHKFIELSVKVIHELPAFFNLDAGYVQLIVACFYF
jgi:hypothetical protein